MKFEIIKSRKIESREVRYFISENSFDCHPSVNADINIAMAYLNLGVDSADMYVKCFWGFSPIKSWKKANLFVPNVVEGELRLAEEFEAGFTWRIDKNKMWKSYFDKKSGWYCIGNPRAEEGDEAVKVINNLITVVDSTNSLKAVWVQPEFV